MSALLNKIKADQIAARKAGDTVRAASLTTLLGEASPSGTQTTDEAAVERTVGRFVKNLKELRGYSTDTYVLAAIQDEIELYEQYLPRQMTEIELEKAISDFVHNRGASDVGSVMRMLKAEHSGQYDGKTASAAAKKVLEAK